MQGCRPCLSQPAVGVSDVDTQITYVIGKENGGKGESNIEERRAGNKNRISQYSPLFSDGQSRVSMFSISSLLYHSRCKVSFTSQSLKPQENLIKYREYLSYSLYQILSNPETLL